MILPKSLINNEERRDIAWQRYPFQKRNGK
jgi:hypothetical protein